MTWGGLFKFLTGFTLAIALLFLAGVGITRYLITQLSTPPPKPIFANDSPTAQASPVARSTTPADQTAPQTPPSPSPTPLPAGAYEAQVNEPIGLVLRQAPSRDSDRIGGVDYNEKLTVLQTSPDGEWEKVRLASSSVEGWIRAGNTDRAN